MKSVCKTLILNNCTIKLSKVSYSTGVRSVEEGEATGQPVAYLRGEHCDMIPPSWTEGALIH